MQDIFIVDTTLRDGEQTPGVAFSKAEKINLARELDALGVPYIEAGIPAMGGDEAESIKEILHLGLQAKIMTWNRVNLRDIQASVNCGARFLHLSAPVSDLHILEKLGKSRQWVLEALKSAIGYARDYGCEVSVGAEDASRADYLFLEEFLLLAKEEGSTRLRFADTVGILDPFMTYEHIKRLTKLGLDIEIHAHNDFGMATANSLAAIRAGAKYVSTTINGIGERAGNCSLEELNLALASLYHRSLSLNNTCLDKISGKVFMLTARNNPFSFSVN